MLRSVATEPLARACLPPAAGMVALGADVCGGAEFRAPAEDAARDAPPPNAWESDRLLMTRVTKRDVAAFARLHERFAPRLFKLALRIVHQRPETEDVLQASFWIIWQRAPEYHTVLGTPFSWAAAIVRHRAIDRLRAHARERQRLRELELDPSSETTDITALSLLTAFERNTAVRAACERLDVEEHRVIDLAFFHGLTHAEIARAHVMPMGTVKSRIRRGMINLRLALANRP